MVGKNKVTKAVTAVGAANKGIESLVFTAVFGSFTKEAWNFFLMATLKLVTFSVAIVTSGIDAAVASYSWYKEKNKNFSTTTDFLVRLAAGLLAIIALIGMVAGLAAIAVVGVPLFLAGMGLRFLYSAGQLILNATRLLRLSLAKSKIDRDVYAKMSGVYKENIKNHTIGVLVTGISGVAVVFLMLLHIVFPPVFLLTVAIAAAGATFLAGVYGVYKQMKSLGESVVPKKEYVLFDAPVAHNTADMTLVLGSSSTPELSQARPETEPLLQDSKSKPAFDFGEYKYYARKDEVLESSRNFEEVKQHLIEKIDAKMELIRGEHEKATGLSRSWQEKRRLNKLELLDDLSVIVLKLEIGTEQVDRAKASLNTLLTTSSPMSNGFQSFWQIRGEVQSLVDEVETFIARASATAKVAASPASTPRSPSR
jgi:hypothetical protein